MISQSREHLVFGPDLTLSMKSELDLVSYIVKGTSYLAKSEDGGTISVVFITNDSPLVYRYRVSGRGVKKSGSVLSYMRKASNRKKKLPQTQAAYKDFLEKVGSTYKEKRFNATNLNKAFSVIRELLNEPIYTSKNLLLITDGCDDPYDKDICGCPNEMSFGTTVQVFQLGWTNEKCKVAGAMNIYDFETMIEMIQYSKNKNAKNGKSQ